MTSLIIIQKNYSMIKGYLDPVYLNVSINDINGDNNKNKNRLLMIDTNSTFTIKIFYNDNTFKNENVININLMPLYLYL